MATTVDRCPKCGQFVYVLELWVTKETVTINAGTRSAFVVDDLEPAGSLKIEEVAPDDVFTRHLCKLGGGV